MAFTAAQRDSLTGLRGLALPLVWTREKPTEPGWYWARDLGFPGIVQLGEDGALTWSNGYRATVPDHMEWAGPIPEPADA